nr:hypothetical protein [Hyphomicrobium sp.]
MRAPPGSRSEFSREAHSAHSSNRGQIGESQQLREFFVDVTDYSLQPPFLQGRLDPIYPSFLITTGNASAAQSGAPASDAAIAALEDKYAFTPLARELLATSHGASAYGRKDYAAAKAWLTSDVAKSNPAAIFFIAEMVEAGNGFQQNAANALGLYIQSANEAFYWAQLRLGNIFNDGIFPG